MTATAGIGYGDAFLPGLVLLGLAVAILPWVDRNNPIARFIALAVCIVLAWQYMLWRIFYTIPPISSRADFLAGVLFTGVEALSMTGATASLVFLTRVRDRTAEATRNLPWLLDRAVAPLIDVLICTYNEDAEILERTMIGALAMSYPNFRVWVCDDGKRAWLGELCRKHGVGYLTRPDNAHAKAGNINAALGKLANLADRAEFVSILDADFVPSTEFLSRATALMREDDVGVVQTPQHFFNPDPIQNNLGLSKVWPDEQRFFFDVVMASKDAWGAAFCCGTSSVIRFDALLGIGGFPTDSVTEDYLVSLRMRQKGFRTVYLNEPLSRGLAPEGLAEYSGQRARWCLGFVQICRGASGPLKFGNALPWVDRIMLCETFLHWSATHSFRLLGVLVPALYLIFDIQAVHANVIDAIAHIFPYFMGQMAIFMWLTEGRVLPVLADVYQMLCALEVLKSVWAGLLRPNGQKFKVTAKGGDRSKRFVQWPLLRIFLTLAAISAFGIANAFLFNPARALAESSAMALFWTWYNLVVLLLASLVCIEQARPRRSERLRTGDPVQMTWNGIRIDCLSIDASDTGMQLETDIAPPLGARVELAFADIATSAEVVRKTPLGVGLRFAEPITIKTKMIQYLFSGRNSNSVEIIDPRTVFTTIMGRILT